MPHVTDHAHDGVVLREIALAMQYASDWVVASPEAARSRLAHDDHQWRGRRSVGIQELAAAHNRDVHRLEVSRADDAPVGWHGGVRWERRASRRHDRC